MEWNADIVIVGGGLAGLALADRLQRAGTDYALLEARDRLGGRILSRVIEGAAFDLGPTWFWPIQPRLVALLDSLRLDVFEQFSDGVILAEDRFGRIHRNAGHASMQGSYRIAGGIGSLTSRLAQHLSQGRVHLGMKVRSLTRESTGVVVGVERGGQAMSIHCKRVVLAVPPRIVEHTIAFSPELPVAVRRTLAAIPTWMAGHAKILAVYDRPYWREKGLSGDAMSQQGPMTEIHDASPAAAGPFALFGFVGTPPEARIGRREEILMAAKEQLGHLFGSEMSTPRHIDLQDWSEDGLTATSADHAPSSHHVAPGTQQLAEGIWGGHVLFAGSECATQFPGYLEGALEAAEDAAERLTNGSGRA